MASILSDIMAAVNPSGTTLSTWALSTNVQPCVPYNGQPTGRPGTGTSTVWLGLACGDSYTGVASNRNIFGGLASISLSGQNLGGTIPSVVRTHRAAR